MMIPLTYLSLSIAPLNELRHQSPLYHNITRLSSFVVYNTHINHNLKKSLQDFPRLFETHDSELSMYRNLSHFSHVFIPSYSISQHKTINNDSLIPLNQATLTITYKSIQLPSAPLTHFDNLPYQQTIDNINQQLSFVEEALPLQLEYELITKLSAKETLNQYQHLYIQDHLVFDKHLLIKYLNQLHSQHTIIEQTKPTADPFVENQIDDEPRTIKPTHHLYKISRQAIRDITHYT